MKKILVIVSLGVFITSCTVTTKMKTSQQKLNRQAEANAMNAKVLNKPIVADLDIAMKREKTVYRCTNLDINSSTISGGASESKKGGFLLSSTETMKNEVKNRSQFKFMEEFKCDYVVDPIYKIETESASGSNVINFTVEISAYPAFYKKFSQPDSLPKSIFEAGRVDSREIPLVTNSSNDEKLASETKSTKGVVFGPSLTSLRESNGNIGGGTLSGGIGAMFGYQATVGMAGKLGFRFEILANTRSFKSEFSSSFFDQFNFNTIRTNYEITGRSIGLGIPLMLDIAATKNIHLHAGPALNATIVGKNVGESSTTVIDDFSGAVVSQTTNDIDDNWEDITRLQLGFGFGALYQSNGSIGFGIRHELGMGVDKWSVTSFLLNINL